MNETKRQQALRLIQALDTQATSLKASELDSSMYLLVLEMKKKLADLNNLIVGSDWE